jgi:hypothetical protein
MTTPTTPTPVVPAPWGARDAASAAARHRALPSPTEGTVKWRGRNRDRPVFVIDVGKDEIAKREEMSETLRQKATYFRAQVCALSFSHFLRDFHITVVY